jgi:hypothetical protein
LRAALLLTFQSALFFDDLAAREGLSFDMRSDHFHLAAERPAPATAGFRKLTAASQDGKKKVANW